MINLYCLEFNMNKSSKDINQTYDRDNICLFAVLSYNSNPTSGFIIANTHLLFNINRGDVKLAQIYQIINSLQKLENDYRKYQSNIRLYF